MENKIKVIYFVDRLLVGGIQTLLVNWAKRIDKEKIQLDFLLLDDGNTYELEDTLRKLGCNIYKLEGIWIRKPTDFLKMKKSVDNFFENHHEYKVLHFHSTSKNYLILKSAKKYNIQVRISHSHNVDFQTKNKFKKVFGNCLKPKLIKYSTNFFSCSKLAGEWLFGKKIVESNKFQVIHNAIDFTKFKYDVEVRNETRKNLNISDDDFVIANVGRFSKQKNHAFLIEIFNEIYNKNPKAFLVLVGTGELEENIKNKVKMMGLESRVFFAGFRNDVDKLYQAFDVFLMPSLHEGLPVVGVEAQASGLPCFMSKGVITDEVRIADNLYFISLKKDAEEWANIILNSDLRRKNNYEAFKIAEYFIEDTTKKLTNFYLK